MTTHTLVPTDQVAPAALHAGFGRAFADYLAGPFDLPLAQWPGFLLRQGVDLSLGRAAVDDRGTVLAFALVAPRPALARWRLATMGAGPEARGSGAAALLMEDLLLRARTAGCRALELEAFAQNERALRLYRRHGLVERHALHGYEHHAPGGDPVAPPADLACTPDQALDWLRKAEAQVVDLPLQVCATVVGALAVPWTAWRRGSAQLVFTGDRATGLVVRSLIDLDAAQHDAQALLQALAAAHPGARIQVPPLQRTDLGGAAALRCGHASQALHQWFMRLDLAAGGAAA